jgi:hypothetical protein
MTGYSGIGTIGNAMTLTRAKGSPMPFKAGAIVKAQVIEVTDRGDAVLRITSEKGVAQEAVIRAYSEVPLARGQNIFLEILGAKNTMTMRFIGDAGNPAESAGRSIPAKFLNLLARLSGSRMDNTEFQRLFAMIRSLPQNIRTAIPEFLSIERLMVDMSQIDGNVLKAFVETSGVAFETRLRIAVMNDPGAMLHGLLALQTEGDLKTLLMKLQKFLRDRNIIHSLRQSGHDVSELSQRINRFLKHIEFFQLTSRINDMFCTFLPLLWDDLKDSEFLFRKERRKHRESYTCDINLDLASMGRLSVSVTVSEGSYYISFFTERSDIKAVIQEGKHLLEDRFASQGLNLKTINVSLKRNISFGKAAESRVNVKI